MADDFDPAYLRAATDELKRAGLDEAAAWMLAKIEEEKVLREAFGPPEFDVLGSVWPRVMGPEGFTARLAGFEMQPIVVHPDVSDFGVPHELSLRFELIVPHGVSSNRVGWHLWAHANGPDPDAPLHDLR